MRDGSQSFAWRRDGDDVLVPIKAVPGASRDSIAGIVGDRLKVRVAAPPERGKANAAICALVAKALGMNARDVTIESGHASPEKVVRIRGVDDATLYELTSS